MWEYQARNMCSALYVSRINLGFSTHNLTLPRENAARLTHLSVIYSLMTIELRFTTLYIPT